MAFLILVLISCLLIFFSLDSASRFDSRCVIRLSEFCWAQPLGQLRSRQNPSYPLPMDTVAPEVVSFSQTIYTA